MQCMALYPWKNNQINKLADETSDDAVNLSQLPKSHVTIHSNLENVLEYIMKSVDVSESYGNVTVLGIKDFQYG